MKTDKEMAEAILQQVQTRKKKQTRTRAALALAIVAVLTLSGALTAQRLGLFPPRAPEQQAALDGNADQSGITEPATGSTEPPAAQQQAAQVPESVSDGSAVATTEGGAAQMTNGITTTANLTTSAPAQQGQAGTTQGASASNDESGGESYGGPVGGVRIPALPRDRTIQYTGEAVTDEEAAAYFKENTWLQSALTSSGVDAGGLRFAERGYCHVSYDGTEGKPLEVRQNFRDYLVWNGRGELIAIVTLTKENGALSATPAFGGPWFGDYSAFLQQHRGEALVFVYAGWMELVLTPDGGIYNPQGTDAREYIGFEKLYETFRGGAASYTP